MSLSHGASVCSSSQECFAVGYHFVWIAATMWRLCVGDVDLSKQLSRLIVHELGIGLMLTFKQNC